MFCNNCGTELLENTHVCGNCGTPVQQTQTSQIPTPPPVPPYIPISQNPTAPVQKVIPEENEPLSPWAYFGLQILFSVPVVGFIFLLIFTFNGSNINRRNFARSYWCGILVVAILCVIFIAMMLILGMPMQDIVNEYAYMTNMA